MRLGLRIGKSIEEREEEGEIEREEEGEALGRVEFIFETKE